ncbi:MAG TPA: sulfite exporter TauE/SafE family protein [Gammaproteobacteria bacterium]|nr:sulfite exporter TauE/SafE family protein [Gammaproteobacteria bacterium]
MPDLSLWQHIAIGLIFIWTGFVRTGLGFGGAALGLPFMLLVIPDPLFFLPLISVHLLFFASLTASTQLSHIDWNYLYRSLLVMLVPFFAGIFGLLNLPAQWLSLLVFSMTFIYALTYAFNITIRSNHYLLDWLLLGFGAYVAGTSLIGAPLIVAVYIAHVAAHQLRNTLFILWIIFVSIKMAAFLSAGINLHFSYAIMLIPLAAIGHYYGLKAHRHMLGSGTTAFRQKIGIVLLLVTSIGIWQSLA